MVATLTLRVRSRCLRNCRTQSPETSLTCSWSRDFRSSAAINGSSMATVSVAALSVWREIALLDQVFEQETPYPRTELIMLIHGSPPQHSSRIATPLRLATRESSSATAVCLTGLGAQAYYPA